MVDVVLHRRGASAGQQIAVRRPPFVTAAFLQGFQRTAVGFIHRRSTKASWKAECSRPVSDRRSIQIEAHRRENWNIQVVNTQAPLDLRCQQPRTTSVRFNVEGI